MYIEPNTNIRLLTNVPLDNSYDHTIYFETETDQISYFTALTKYNLNYYTYQRVNNGVTRVGIKADSLYDCNYMMFQNTNFGSKWFYAFITKVEYVNNVTSNVYFEIDVMQTWHFDYTMGQCFVEREHTATDLIGQHIEPESIDIGEYVMQGYGQLVDLSDLAVIIMINDTSTAPEGTLYNGVYCGSTMFAYNATDVTSIKNKLDSYVQKPDAVTCMYMCPVIALGIGTIPEGGTQDFGSNSGYSFELSGNAVSDSDTLDGYKPKNNKMYTYPYNFFHVDDGSSGELNLRYEFFTSGVPKVRIDCCDTLPVKLSLHPVNYKGVTGRYMPENLMIENFPMCSWNTDTFKAWVAQNSLPLGAGIGGSIIAGAVAVSNPIGALAVGGAVINQVTGALASGYKASISAPIAKGNYNAGNVNCSVGIQTFFGGRCSVNKYYAEMIDNYFTMYGYAVKKCKIPNRNLRPHWNYVKTVGCVVDGSVPADDMKSIINIYNNGITFWNNGSEIGNYNYDNSPTEN